MPIHCRLLLLAIWGGFGLAYFRGLLMLLRGILLDRILASVLGVALLALAICFSTVLRHCLGEL
jgi:hypothetical protein